MSTAKDKFLLSDRVLERKNYVESFGVKCGKMCQLRGKHTGLCRNLQNTIWCVFVAVLGENFLWLVERALWLVRTTILLAISPLVTKV